jgi:alanine-alpha-ketoisovalerate/valine-pyruvate aminotransferase
MHVQMREEELLRLEAVTQSVGIPLLIARSYGLMGYVRVGWVQARIVTSPER